jgi:hypothetical protein
MAKGNSIVFYGVCVHLLYYGILHSINPVVSHYCMCIFDMHRISMANQLIPMLLWGLDSLPVHLINVSSEQEFRGCEGR